MTEADLARIEGGLGIKLPPEYRELMLSRAPELSKVGLGDIIYLDADDIIVTNLVERKHHMGTAYAFPNWWKKFILIGTDGGGNYYSLRLDDNRKVWMIGSDCGDKPTAKHASLSAFVEKELDAYR